MSARVAQARVVPEPCAKGLRQQLGIRVLVQVHRLHLIVFPVRVLDPFGLTQPTEPEVRWDRGPGCQEGLSTEPEDIVGALGP